MDSLVIIVVVISSACLVAIKSFRKDNKHDLEVQVGKFKFSIKKHN